MLFVVLFICFLLVIVIITSSFKFIDKLIVQLFVNFTFFNFFIITTLFFFLFFICVSMVVIVRARITIFT